MSSCFQEFLEAFSEGFPPLPLAVMAFGEIRNRLDNLKIAAAQEFELEIVDLSTIRIVEQQQFENSVILYFEDAQHRKARITVIFKKEQA